ncbi:MAG: heavy-metal-associated domain-containing protein [Clostridium sp.]|nr:heavy-metal-associated domain-containing protein [Clostridium sp.]
MSTAVISVLVVVAAALGIKSYLKRLSSGCCGSSGEKAPRRVKVADRDMSHYPYEKILKVDGMSCGNCAVRVENALNSLEGVWARVDLEAEEAQVYMKEEYEDQRLKDAVRDAGYRVYKVNKVK